MLSLFKKKSSLDIWHEEMAENSKRHLYNKMKMYRHESKGLLQLAVTEKMKRQRVARIQRMLDMSKGLKDV